MDKIASMVFGKTYYTISDKEEDNKVLSSEAANYVASSEDMWSKLPYPQAYNIEEL